MEMPIGLIRELPKNEELLSYNSKELRMDRNKLSNFREEMVVRYYRVVLSLKLKEEVEDHEPVLLEATGSLRLLVQTKELD
jgi:hypothetical protein